MASASSFASRNYKFNVFSSFHGPDVRKTLLSHMREQFKRSGITMFNDQEIVRSQEIAPLLTNGIRESKISIVILSKKNASSSWCLDELVEILKCKETMGQIVMTIFYGVEPSDVRFQTGDFGIAFNETCADKPDEERQKWSKALKNVGNIAGEDFQKWDFDGMVGLETHLREMENLLDFDYDGVKMVGISGPAGIENLRGSYPSSGLDDYGLQFLLQEQLLSKVLNQDGTRICHLGVLQQRLSNLRVLIILDDVTSLKQLEALAGDTSWFGFGSRIMYTIYAFKQCYPTEGFKKLAIRITELCCKLPLALRVVGSSLRGKRKDEWTDVMVRLENILDQDIEKVLKIGYESLEDNEQTLFLYIAIFFKYKDGDLVKTMLAGIDLDVKNGLKILVKKSLIEISARGEIVMHRLLQVGKRAIRRLKPWNRQILVDANDICDVLQNDTVSLLILCFLVTFFKNICLSNKVVGISFNTSAINEVFISKGAFKGMPNLRFLHWKAYPSKCLPATFHSECLVELDLRESQLEKLWEGIQPLTNLKRMDLCNSYLRLILIFPMWDVSHQYYHLKELPDLSNAPNLEKLKLGGCQSLIELPPTTSNLGKLNYLCMISCTKLEVVPSNCTFASPNPIDIQISRTNMTTFGMSVPAAKEVPPVTTLSISREFSLCLSENPNLKTLTQLPATITTLDLSFSGIETICCLKGLHMLREIRLFDCTELKSLPELPCFLKSLNANYCESLETVPCPLMTPFAKLSFTNCFKLDQQARNEIANQRFHLLQLGWSWLPGTQVPAEFEHRAIGNTLSFPISALSIFKVCLVCSSNNLADIYDKYYLSCRWMRKGYSNSFQAIEIYGFFISSYQHKHLLVFPSYLLLKYGCFEESGELTFEFTSVDFDVIECGVHIFKEELDGSNNGGSGDEDGDSNHWNTQESGQDSDEDEEADIISDTISESGPSEASGGDGVEEDYISVSRKRAMNTTMTGASINLKWGTKRRRF
uniref:TIR domain-containing protein n=1 Tax=Brassica oleracea TaxID=3712 RepID=A0A3P6EA59_BRAOL|nr:unnamed protein product [Brassica oleracea]